LQEKRSANVLAMTIYRLSFVELAISRKLTAKKMSCALDEIDH